jgi:hypothetical protein
MVGFVGRYIEGGKVRLLVGTKASNIYLDPNLYQYAHDKKECPLLIIQLKIPNQFLFLFIKKFLSEYSLPKSSPKKSKQCIHHA